MLYWEKWTGREGAAIQRVIDRYNESQHHAWVHRVSIADLPAKAMVAIGGGDPPDLVGLFSFNVPHYAEARAVMAMDEFARSDEFDLDRYAPHVRDILTHEGRAWGGINTCSTSALFFNRTHLREIGLDAPPRTLDAFDEAAAALTVTDATGRIQRAGFLQTLPGWWPYLWALIFDCPLYDPATHRAIIADDRAIAAMHWVQETARRLGVGATRAFSGAFPRTYHSAQDPFISERVSMILQGPWLSAFIREHNPALDWGCVPMPLPADAPEPHLARGMVEGDVLMIPRGCPHPEEAFDFLLFTQLRENQELLAKVHGKGSPMREISDSFREGHTNPEVTVFDAIARSHRARILPQTRIWKQYADMVMSAFDAVWGGESPESALLLVERRAQQLLDLDSRRNAAHGPNA